MRRRGTLRPVQAANADPLWYKDAVIYELRVRSFADSDADGIGDFRGLTERLDYLQDLGVTALWILPHYPSPLRDDGYDISDYTSVHPELGTIEDFQAFLGAAHRRGLRVITELVLNHTSDQHPWFQRARRAPPGSRERDFYVWSDTADRYREARIIFKDFEPSNWSWDPLAKAYFWHRFYAHQPDLNFENPDVQAALLEAVDFWLHLGVDGLRLDAVPYLYEEEGTTCENLPRTHEYLRKLRTHVDERFPNRMLLAEANQWPEDAAEYFGRGDECHMNFHFPIMPRLFMSIHMEDRFPIIDILAQTPMLHESCQWAMFLRNHDELTLEMVTDEERDYMYHAYAHEPTMRINLGIRRRLAPLVGNDRRKMELMNALLFSLPGTPVLYYGDEIGMGDNVYLGDRNGVRTPMQWSPDRNAGFSRANPQRLILPVVIDAEYHYEALNVEAQQSNPNSLLWWTKRLMALRRRFQAFGRGTIEFLSPENHRVLAYLRRHGDETVLVVANLSRHVQPVELDLRAWAGQTPVELFGGTRFPTIGDLPYLLTLGGHHFYWFSIERPRSAADDAREAEYQPLTLEVDGPWRGVLAPEVRGALEQLLPEFLEGRRYYAGRGRQLARARIADVFPHGDGPTRVELAVVRAEYAEGPPDRYVLPLAFAAHDGESPPRSPHAVVAHLLLGPTARGVLYDALDEAGPARELLAAFTDLPHVRNGSATLGGGPLPGAVLADLDLASLDTRVVRTEHSSAVVVYGNRLFLKLYRRLDEGTSVDLELRRFLATRAPGDRGPVPELLGYLEYRDGRADPATIATLSTFLPGAQEGGVWLRGEISRYLERALAQGPGVQPVVPEGSLLSLTRREAPREDSDRMGVARDAMALLGRRAAELHLALVADGPFAPETYSAADQRSAYQSMRNVAGMVMRALRGRRSASDDEAAALGRELLDQEAATYRRFEPLRDGRVTALRQRVHGNLSLANTLADGKDFLFVDLEGDRSKTLAERRRKRSPLRDVATMIRSLHECAFAAGRDERIVRAADRPAAEGWARVWYRYAAATFVRGYLERARGSTLAPPDGAELEVLLDAFLLEAEFHALRIALDHEPAAVLVHLHGVLSA